LPGGARPPRFASDDLPLLNLDSVASMCRYRSPSPPIADSVHHDLNDGCKLSLDDTRGNRLLSVYATRATSQAVEPRDSLLIVYRASITSLPCSRRSTNRSTCSAVSQTMPWPYSNQRGGEFACSCAWRGRHESARNIETPNEQRISASVRAGRHGKANCARETARGGRCRHGRRETVSTGVLLRAQLQTQT
jgi:hypothetical protein